MSKVWLGACLLLALGLPAWAQDQPAAPLSPATQACLECHRAATPGIVGDWLRGRMARTTPAQALAKPQAQRRLSAAKVPAELQKFAVGCAECHTLRPDKHSGTFEHEGHKVHSVVSPADCATCHPVEDEQFSHNLMSHARGNLLKNPVYTDLMGQVNGIHSLTPKGLSAAPPHPLDQAESCLACHGTEIKAQGEIKKETDFGEMSFPRLAGWPNRGVGRLNMDGSLGACSACHSRHQFSIETARNPATCSECHSGPDVVAYKVYIASKHGKVYAAQAKHWNLDAVPWTLGKDFNAPTCASCHMSLLVDGDGNQIAARSHRMNDRLWWRLLGLIYSHPHPQKPDTSIIKSPDGLSLATALDGRPASKFLISSEEQQKRRQTMGKICQACHSSQWVAGQWANLEQSIKSSDAMTKTATALMQDIWQKKLAQGLPDNSPFDEYPERIWLRSWLFYANSIRLATAMMGPDYGVFEGGRWNTTLTVRHLEDWLKREEKKK